MDINIDAMPPLLKSLRPYLKVAREHAIRDPVIAYWCVVYVLQTGLKIESKPKDSFNYLVMLMDWLEKEKKARGAEDSITNEVAAQAYLENYSLKLFVFADSEDRASKFSKNLVKTFYTVSLLFDILSNFGELSEEIEHHKKYSKWKATYINNCLNEGITPMPGPMKDENEAEDENQPSSSNDAGINFPVIPNYNEIDQPSTSTGYTPYHPPTSVTFNDTNLVTYNQDPEPPATVSTSGVALNPDDINLAMKYCKWAGSSLQYQDVPGAVENLQKALTLLTTGQKL